MNRLQKAVLEFNSARGEEYEFGLPAIGKIHQFTDQVIFLREEIKEMIDALVARDLIEFLDGAVDSLYVLLHFFNMVGVDLDPLFDEVQRSNMSKLEGGVIIEDGKIQKGAHYFKPDLESVLREAMDSFYDEYIEAGSQFSDDNPTKRLGL